jgi:dTMP kinase
LRGYFVSLEGVEGSGKTTQAAQLEEALRGEGVQVIGVREPGGTRLGEAVRSVVLDAGHDNLSAWAEANLYTAARAQLVKEVILPQLARGVVVVADRYADSTIAYQGAGRGLEMAVLGAMQAVLKLRPDLTVLLDVDPEVGRQRQLAGGHQPDRMEREDSAFHARVRQGYLDLAARDPDRFHVVDAALDPGAVAAEILRVTMERATAHGVPSAHAGDKG